MLRPAIQSFVDQALLSGLSFALSVALIWFAPAAEYGLYAQLLNLQSLFSFLHAGIFVSGLLALHPSLAVAGRLNLTRRLALEDTVFGLGAAPLMAAMTYFGARLLGSPISAGLAAASALATLGLWWREFARVTRFADLRADHVLGLDVGYAALVVMAVVSIASFAPLTAGSVLLATGIAGVTAGGYAITRLVRAKPADRGGPTWRDAWRIGQWDTYGSVVTWLQAQSYVYFAAAAGGLALAGAVSAARLIGMPLALGWASGASLLRVVIATSLATGDLAAVRRLLRRAQFVVAAASLGYGAVVAGILPVIDHILYQHKFPGLGTHVAWWLAYFTLTGFSTAGAAAMRGALRMAPLFWFYVVASGVTLAALCATAMTHRPGSLVTCLVAGELVLAALIWTDIRKLLRSLQRPAVHTGLPSSDDARVRSPS